ncbi:carboxymuconolactone decarboxylase [Rhodoplanes elegans]|uniref:Carboxymuconolactone decarboxylase n=1 Tax=Rhodoplanes elegans TaxID=29408 RepID=A0A327KWD8_9BRAD|nr:carboxymuconolactone decarboxylase family protein [Rhodoplanes elegans]MBK5958477.1 carboxymuconolactone decarboxylase [Rhodoplanes elegans]RAI39688.1 carboxymuconolactone decarboxylase [Rhodoplanes elegans]
MPRIPLPEPDEMTDDQRAVHATVVTGKRGKMIGPLRAVIHSPELARRWSALGEFLRYDTCLPPRLNELAIIVVGRHYTSQVEWWAHSAAAAAAGLGAEIIEAIRVGEAPVFADPDEADVYEFARQLVQSGQVEDAVYAAIVQRFGARGAVELAGVVGYYTMVSMTLNVHVVPLPDGLADPIAPLPQSDGLITTLPPARRI